MALPAFQLTVCPLFPVPPLSRMTRICGNSCRYQNKTIVCGTTPVQTFFMFFHILILIVDKEVSAMARAYKTEREVKDMIRHLFPKCIFAGFVSRRPVCKVRLGSFYKGKLVTCVVTFPFTCR